MTTSKCNWWAILGAAVMTASGFVSIIVVFSALEALFG